MRIRRKLKRPSECTLNELGERYKELMDSMKKHYSLNKDKYLIYAKTWREKNPEKYKESCKEASKRRWLKMRKKPNWVRPKNEKEREQRKKESSRKCYLKNREEILKKYHNNKNK